MKFTPLAISGVLILEPNVFEDQRGFFLKVSTSPNLRKRLVVRLLLYKTITQNQQKVFSEDFTIKFHQRDKAN